MIVKLPAILKNCLIVWVLSSLTCTALAQKATVGMSERMFKLIGEAQVLLEAEDYAGARELVTPTLERRLTDYERSHLLNLIAYTWYEQDELAEAIRYYQQALALEEIPESQVINLRTTLGQVLLVTEDYAAAEEQFRLLLALPEQAQPVNKVLLAATLIGQEKYEDALQPLIEAVEVVETDGSPPRENWLSMLSSVYYELQDYPAMRSVIRQLSILYPREQYLINLAALHGQLGDMERQLAVIESLLDDRRLSQETQLRMIVNLYLGQNLPYEAATLLEEALDSGAIEREVSQLELLSQAWYLSAEPDRAVAPLEEAASLSESGELYLRLARLHMDAYRWEEADRAASLALERGGLREEGHAWLVRGMASVRMERFNEARRGFRKAAEFDYTQEYAEQWLTYVESEEQRAELAVN